MGTRNHIGMALVCLGTLAAPVGALTPADKCEAAKLKIAGKYGFCRMKAESKAVKTGTPPDYTKCVASYVSKWSTAESTGGGMCPTNGDDPAVDSFIIQHTDDLTAYLAGGVLPDCPGDLATCEADLALCEANPQGTPLETAQTGCWDSIGSSIACAGTGHDGELQKGLSRQYVDNGDGTVTDLSTGLMWEKLSDDGSIHQLTNVYTWAGAFAKVATLNSSTFAGYGDWRLPNVNELHSIVSYGTDSPAVDPIFNTGCMPGCTVLTCSCTLPIGNQWTSTTDQSGPAYAWVVDFGTGSVAGAAVFTVLTPYLHKGYLGFGARAVRGGS